MKMLKFLLIVLWASSSLSQPTTNCLMNYTQWCNSLKDTFTEDPSCQDKSISEKYQAACDFVSKHNEEHSTYKLRVNRHFHRMDYERPVQTEQCNTKTNTSDHISKNWYTEIPSLGGSKVRDQGDRQHGYAMAAVDSVQAWYAIRHKRSVALSVWNVVECTFKDAKGRLDTALRHLQTTEHVTEEDSPYRMNENSTGVSCKNTPVSEPHFDYAALNDTGDDTIIKTLNEHGPIAIAMHAKFREFGLYDHGVFEHPDCSSGGPDHAVLLVGYGHDNSTDTPYWIIRNSWGAEWGEVGYMRVKRGGECNCLKPRHAYYLRGQGHLGNGGSSNSAMDYRINILIVVLAYIMRNIKYI